MDSLQCLHLKGGLRIADGSQEFPLPEWAASLVWLGAWCRKHQVPGKRLVTFAVLPTRDAAAAFACVGSLIAGAQCFEDTLSWPRFRTLPLGTIVFWKQRQAKKTFSGSVVGFENMNGTEFIKVQKGGVTQSFSEHYFEDYLFSVDRPPAARKADSFRKAGSLIEHVLEEMNPRWLWTDGTEAILVTSMARFELSIADISLVADGQLSAPLSDLLCMGNSSTQAHAKLRISHPRGNISGSFPLAILDGPEAFQMHEHLDASTNILAIIDRSEYQEAIHGIVLQLRSMAENDMDRYLADIPDSFPLGVELGAYVIEQGR